MAAGTTPTHISWPLPLPLRRMAAGIAQSARGGYRRRRRRLLLRTRPRAAAGGAAAAAGHPAAATTAVRARIIELLRTVNAHQRRSSTDPWPQQSKEG